MTIFILVFEVNSSLSVIRVLLISSPLFGHIILFTMLFLIELIRILFLLVWRRVASPAQKAKRRRRKARKRKRRKRMPLRRRKMPPKKMKKWR